MSNLFDGTNNKEKKILKRTKLIKLDGIAGKSKKFDQKLHDKYDVEAREVIKNIFGSNIIDNEDIYAEDMIFGVKPFPYKYLEIQVLSLWDREEFPYTNPFVYARKMKYSKKTLFITFNRYMNEFIIFGRNSIEEKPSVLKKYSREKVNFVPWNKSLRSTTDKLTLDLIRIYAGEFVDE